MVKQHWKKLKRTINFQQTCSRNQKCSKKNEKLNFLKKKTWWIKNILGFISQTLVMSFNWQAPFAGPRQVIQGQSLQLAPLEDYPNWYTWKWMVWRLLSLKAYFQVRAVSFREGKWMVSVWVNLAEYPWFKKQFVVQNQNFLTYGIFRGRVTSWC